MRLRILRFLAVFSMLCALISAKAAPADDKTLTGFDREGAERQRALEARYGRVMRKENLRGGEASVARRISRSVTTRRTRS